MPPLPALQRAATALAALCLTSSAWAIQNGIVTDVPPAQTVIANPFVTTRVQPVDAWKLVGRGSCSVTRISHDWVIAAAHCPYGSAADLQPFSNEWMGSAWVNKVDCADPVAVFGFTGPGKENDFQLCRLQDASTLTEPLAYPPLAVMPPFNTANAPRLGALMVRGMTTRNGEPLQVSLTDLNGVQIGLDAATVSANQRVPYVVNGDSGGGVFWLPPDGRAPALVGVVSALRSTIGGITVAPWYYTADNLTKIVGYIQAQNAAHGRNDTLPVVYTTTDGYYKASTPIVGPSMMTAAPSLAPVSSTNPSSVQLSWVAPTSAVAIHRYQVKVAQDGQVTQTVQTTGASSLSFTVTGLKASANSRVCVTPVNDQSGLATTMYASIPQGDPVVVTVGCRDFDNRIPAAVRGLLGAIVSRTSATATIAMSWTAGDTATARYRVTQTTSFPSGPKRVVTQDLTTGGLVTSVAKGATLCTQVTPWSSLGWVGPTSPNTCVTAN